jgi:hypothetical protein
MQQPNHWEAAAWSSIHYMACMHPSIHRVFRLSRLFAGTDLVTGSADDLAVTSSVNA